MITTNFISSYPIKFKAPYAAPKINLDALRPFAAKTEPLIGNSLSTRYFSNVTGQPLNKRGKGCEFFGVACWEQLMNKLENHAALLVTKAKWIVEGFENGHIVNMPAIIYLDELSSLEKGKEELYSNIGDPCCQTRNYIDELNLQKAGRWTLYSKEFFGESRLGALSHTIGLVPHHKNLLVLDSLGEGTELQKQFHSKIRYLLSDAGYENIIFSTKVQQPITEFSCNNWTYANINSVLNYIFRNKDAKINSSEELNRILEEDINTILENQLTDVEQFKYEHPNWSDARHWNFINTPTLWH